MNKILKGLLFSFVALIVLSLLFSVILASINFPSTSKIPEIVSLIVSFILFFLVGAIYGMINKKQGLGRGLLLCLVYVLIICIYYLFIDKSNISSLIYLKVAGRVLLLVIGSIIGVNIADKKAKLK